MANNSLAAGSLSRNDISRLSRFFESIFQYCARHASSLEPEYIDVLKTIVGLGFAAALINDETPSYGEHLEQFLAHELNCFVAYQGDISQLAAALAEMLNVSLDNFVSLRFPAFYGSFITAVHRSLDHPIVNVAEKRAEALSLFQLLLQKQ